MDSTFLIRLEKMLHKHLFNTIFISGYWLLKAEFKDIKNVVVDSQLYIYIYIYIYIYLYIILKLERIYQNIMTNCYNNESSH